MSSWADAGKTASGAEGKDKLYPRRQTGTPVCFSVRSAWVAWGPVQELALLTAELPVPSAWDSENLKDDVWGQLVGMQAWQDEQQWAQAATVPWARHLTIRG